MKLINSLKSAILLVCLSTVFVSCGGQAPMVDDVKVQTNVIDGDIWVDLSADLSIGNVQLPVTTLPIILPKTGEEIGTLSLNTNGAGENQLNVAINVSDTANLDLEQVRLPNGAAIPLIGDNQVIVVPIGKGAEVYISVSQNSASVGVSIPIKSFDSIGQKVGTTSVMPIFNKNGVVGAAGIFTSKNAGQNGFALVADVSSFLNDFVSAKMLASHDLKRGQQAESSGSLNAFAPSKSKKKKIDRALLKMHKRKQQLQLH